MQAIVATSLFRPLESYRRSTKSSTFPRSNTDVTSYKELRLGEQYSKETKQPLLEKFSNVDTSGVKQDEKIVIDNNNPPTFQSTEHGNNSHKDPCHCQFRMSEEHKISTFTIPDISSHHKTSQLCNCVYRQLEEKPIKSKQEAYGVTLNNSLSCIITPIQSPPYVINPGRQRSHTVGELPLDSTVNVNKSPVPLIWLSNMDIIPALMASNLSLSSSYYYHDNNQKTYNDANCLSYANDTPAKSSSKSKALRLAGDIIRSILDFSALRDWQCLSNVIAYVLGRAHMFIAMYIPSYAITMGLEKHQAALLVSIFGIVDMISRVIYGYLGDLQFIRPRYIIAFTCTIMAGFGFAGSLFQTFESLVCFSVVLGLFGAVTLSLNTNNIVDMAGIENLGVLLSLGSLLLSFSCTVQFPLCGILIEATGDFLSVFYYASGSYCMAVAFLLSGDVWRMFTKR